MWNTMNPVGRILTGAILLTAAAGNGARIYYTDQPAGMPGSVMSVAPDGTDQRAVITISGSDLRGIAYHRASGRIYFLDNGTAKRIYSILPDGTDQQAVVPLGAGTFNSDLEIDELAGHLYWADTGAGSIMRSALNGTNVVPAVSPGAGTYVAPYFFFVDRPGGYIYWGVLGDTGTSNFRRATLAGVIDPNFVITTTSRTRDIAIEPTSATAYWCDRQSGSILRRPLSGGANQTVISSMNAPHGIALDLEAGKVYWADTGARGSGPQDTSARRIARFNFERTAFEIVSTRTLTSEPWDLALDTSSPTYADWRTRFFSATASAAGPNDDADADGAANLLEYAMGTHPNRSTSVPRVTAESGGMKYTRRVGSNLSYRVDVSTDLSAWHYNGDGSEQTWTVETSVMELSPELEMVTVGRGSALGGARTVFFRVRVTMP
jgi:hypothetical protein